MLIFACLCHTVREALPNGCSPDGATIPTSTYTPVSGRGCSSYVHMDDPYTHGVTGGSTTLEQCAAAVLAYNGQDGCVANYFFFESGGYCNCPRDATCSETPNSNAGSPGQLYRFTGGSTLFVTPPTGSVAISASCNTYNCYADVLSSNDQWWCSWDYGGEQHSREPRLSGNRKTSC